MYLNIGGDFSVRSESVVGVFDPVSYTHLTLPTNLFV